MPKIVVKPYAIFREILGTRELLLDLPDGSTIMDVLNELCKINDRFEKIVKKSDRFREDFLTILRNGRGVDLKEKVEDGDEISLFPPVSGGLTIDLVRKRELDIPGLVNSLLRSSQEVGALVIFLGVVRGKSDSKDVEKLSYECHEELARKKMHQIVMETLEKFDDVLDASFVHVIDELEVGEPIVFIGVAARHRDQAFRAAREIVERMKSEVPIWKKEFFKDGGSRWVGVDIDLDEI